MKLLGIILFIVSLIEIYNHIYDTPLIITTVLASIFCFLGAVYNDSEDD